MFNEVSIIKKYDTISQSILVYIIIKYAYKLNFIEIHGLG